MGKNRSTGRRVTGASVSALGFGGGVSSTPLLTDRDIAQALVTFLEDRRVLFNPEWLEVSSQVDHSVQEIRKELTEALQQLDPTSAAVEPVRVMRAACRRYLDGPRQKFRHLDTGSYRGGHEPDPGFFVALGELRAVFGAELKRLDSLFKVKMESQLRSLLPE